MTVQELIETLKTLPQDLQVIVATDEHDLARLSHANVSSDEDGTGEYPNAVILFPFYPGEEEENLEEID